MSDSKIISPLLDGFTLGSPISEHHGVICCPAIKENTNKKFIVKIISVPATQVQFDAMLLAGAYKDPGDAMEYFRQQGESILQEAEVLKKLSRLEGFLSYDGWQMEAFTRRRLGYEVYLVGSYKRSLEKFMRKNAFTHLEAVNLGLDLCAALSVCRQSGYIYADLKPSNIYVSEKKEFRIGDLGFLDLNALRYTSLPERYYSTYTPPELTDPMSSVNLTVDTYAVGMILYQLYNDGQLPFTGTAPLEEIPVPCHADYEMAEIIMKAIHPDHQQRWTDPREMGKAIASYMQRNSINDIPITPFIPLDVKPEDMVPVISSKALDKQQESLSDDPIQEDISAAETEVVYMAANEPDETVFTDNMGSEDTAETNTPDETSEAEAEEVIAEAIAEPVPDEEAVTETEAVSQSDAASEKKETPDDMPVGEISEEVAKIISKANDIIAHEIPADTVFPAEEAQQDPFAFALDDSDEMKDDLPEEPLMDVPATDTLLSKSKKTKHFENTARKDKRKKIFSVFLLFLLFCGICTGGFWYYQNIYLQPVDSMTISGTQDQITVLIDTSVEESKLTVHCTDSAGKRQSAVVQGGKAIFSNLKSNTQYTIRLDIAGLHKLMGKTSDVFTTDAPTRVLEFQAIAGAEDGSVMLTFTVEGNEPDFWNIRYTAEGEEERLETVTGHSAMISDLTVGKQYSFTLDGGKHFAVSGETTTSYLASRLVLAENLTVTSTDGTDITVHWKTPGDVVVESWDIRCYDGYGFEECMTVTENHVSFTGMDPSSKYTVEVTAAGMIQPSRISITADPLYISDFQLDDSGATKLQVKWNYTGTEPEGGWLLLYTIDGSGSQVIQCSKPSAEIAPLIPGANYQFVLQSADSRTVINNTLNHHTNEAKDYTENAYKRENVTIDLLKTPEDSDWSYETIDESAFTSTFAAGDSASMVLRSTTAVYLPGVKEIVLFVFRDSFGNVLPDISTEESLIWKNIWMGGDSKIGEIDIPKLPNSPGEYTMELYFNGCSAATFNITITE